MKKLKNAVNVIFISTLSFSAFNAHAVPYLSGQIGYYGQGTNDVVDNLFNHNTDRQLTGRFAGGYEWSMNDLYNLGLEAGLNGYKKTQVDIGHTGINLLARRTSLDVLGVINGFVTPEINVFAKAGLALVKQKYPAQYQRIPFLSMTENNIVPKMVMGVGYDLSDNVNVNLSLNHEFKRNDFAPAASALLVGIQYYLI